MNRKTASTFSTSRGKSMNVCTRMPSDHSPKRRRHIIAEQTGPEWIGSERNSLDCSLSEVFLSSLVSSTTFKHFHVISCTKKNFIAITIMKLHYLTQFLASRIIFRKKFGSTSTIFDPVTYLLEGLGIDNKIPYIRVFSD